jgi:hypothetical protein
MASLSYLEAINWISQHDQPDHDDAQLALMRYPTVRLVAHLFGYEPARVAKDVWIDRHRTTPTA